MGATDRNVPKSFEDMEQMEQEQTAKDHVILSVDGLTIETTEETQHAKEVTPKTDEPSE